MKEIVPNSVGDLGIVKGSLSDRVGSLVLIALGLAMLLAATACGSAEEPAATGPSAAEIARAVQSQSGPQLTASDVQKIVDSAATQQSAPAAARAPITKNAPMAAAAAAQSPPIAQSQAAMSAPPTGRSAPVSPPSATTFRDYQQSRFESTAEDSVSTFSLDTDRTSFQLALNWARAGHELDPDSVRAEEWINAFNYGYDLPAHRDSFAITTDVFTHPLDSRMHLVRLGFQAPELQGDTPLNVTLVLDASGSMSAR